MLDTPSKACLKHPRLRRGSLHATVGSVKIVFPQVFLTERFPKGIRGRKKWSRKWDREIYHGEQREVCMNVLEYDDKLEPVGTVVGAFIVFAGVGTLLGLSWLQTDETLAILVQLIGIFTTIGVGLALIFVARDIDPRTLRDQ